MSSSSGDDRSSSSDEEEQEVSGLLPKFLLTGIMKHGVLSTEQATGIIERSCKYLKVPFQREYQTVEGIDRLISEINKDIKRFQMQIKKTKCEFTGEPYFVFFMKKEVPILKFQTTFKKGEIEMIQSCFNGMLTNHENFSLTMEECVQQAQKTSSKMSNAEARAFVQKLISMFYLAKNEDLQPEDQSNYYVTLGFRAVQELSSIIKDKHEGVIGSCALCVKDLLHGLKCPNERCDVLVHKYCAKDYLESPKQKQCKGCKTAWNSLDELKLRGG